MKKRFLKVTSMLAAVLAAGIVYYLISDFVTLKCPIHFFTGLYCPGCGVTRMCIHLIELDIYAAFRSNCAVFICLPFLTVFFAVRTYGYIKTGKYLCNTPMKIMLYALIVVLVAFGVLRNIPAFYFLLPQ